MSTLLSPPAPHEELNELCLLLGSNGAAARFLGRERVQIGRWLKPGAEIRPGSAGLIDEAWNAACLIVELVGRERLPTAVHQRWPVLDYKSPAEYIHEGRPDELIAVLREAAATVAPEETGEAEDDELMAWFADSFVATAAPAPLEAIALEDDDDELPAPILSEAWRGGGTMSSERWFRS
jgi:hypothetical protein